MATFDYSIVPAVVTITNIAVAKPAYDAGTRPNDEGIKEIPGTREIQLYKNNSHITLESGDSVSLIANTSDELAYYMSLGKDFKIESEKKSS